jgi:hypothetical protein
MNTFSLLRKASKKASNNNNLAKRQDGGAAEKDHHQVQGLEKWGCGNIIKLQTYL